MKRLFALVFLIWTVWAPPALAQPGSVPGSERRVALVIGNNDYAATTKLERAVTDARAMGAELRQVGFQVIEHSNLDRRGMNQAINELVDKVSGGGVGVLFFAGHGVQVSGTNYLLPTDIKVSRAEDLVDEAIDLGRVMDRLAVAKAKFALLIIDACRDNPFPRTPGRSIGAPRGLTIPSAPDGLMVVYSAGVNEQALDKLDAADRDPNGLFTREFLKQIRQPGVRVDEMVRRVRTSVREQAQRIGHAQNPAIYDQAQGEFYFVSPIAVQAAVALPVLPPAAPAAQTSAAAAKSEEVAYELAFWDAIKSTSAASDYEEYLRQFPSGRFAGLARARRDRLLAAAVPAAQAMPAAQTTPAQPAVSSAGVPAQASASTSPPTNTPLRPAEPKPAAPVVQSAAPALALAAPVIPAPAAPQPAMAAPVVAPAASSDPKPPASLVAIQGKRFFGRSQSYEMEVEVVGEGLRVIRFGTVDGLVQYRCGLFRNEIAIADGMKVSAEACGASGFSTNQSGGAFGYPRFVTGSFPAITVTQGLGSTNNREDLLLVEMRLRDGFDAMLKTTPGLTTESFANRQYGQVATYGGQAVPVAPAASIGQGAAGTTASAAATQVASAAPSAVIVTAPTTASELLKPPASLASIRGKRYFGRSQDYEIEVEAVAGGLKILRFETKGREIQYRCGLVRNELVVSDAMVIATQGCGNSSFSSGGLNPTLGYPREVSGIFPRVKVQRSTGSAAAQEVLFLDVSLRARFDDMVRTTPDLTTKDFAELQ